MWNICFNIVLNLYLYKESNSLPVHSINSTDTEQQTSFLHIQEDAGISILQDCNQQITLKRRNNDEGKVKKKAKRRKKNTVYLPKNLRGQASKFLDLPPEIQADGNLLKYWLNRYRLFSKFDEGIKLDAGM